MLKRLTLSDIARAKDCHIGWCLKIERTKHGRTFYLMETDCTLLVSYISDNSGFRCWVDEIKLVETVRTYDATTDKWSERDVDYVISDKHDAEMFEFLCRMAIDEKELEARIQDKIAYGELAA